MDKHKPSTKPEDEQHHDGERPSGAKRPDTLRPGPVEGRRADPEPRHGEELDEDERSIATEEDEDTDDDEDMDDDEDIEEENPPARPVK